MWFLLLKDGQNKYMSGPILGETYAAFGSKSEILQECSKIYPVYVAPPSGAAFGVKSEILQQCRNAASWTPPHFS